jgi:ketosteroid isomerase-like protein
MLLSLLALAATAAVAAGASSETGTAGPAEKTLRDLDAQMQLAVLRQDTEALDRLLSADWVLIASSGKVISRPVFLALVSDPRSRLEVNEPSEVTVRVHGSTGIVTAILHERGEDQGKPHEAWLRYTDTWALEGGRWLYVAGHACRMAPPAERP